MKTPLILVTNDDGITSPGIKALIEAAQYFGDVVIVAPDSAQSGMGHAITLSKPLRMQEVSGLFQGVHSAYQTSGTPVDCVKLAVDQVLHRKPDLLISGINHGSNSSINVIYSGTMSAAVEGGLEGIPSIGFSLLDYSWDANFSLAQKVARSVIEKTLFHHPEEHFVLNVNIPNIHESEFKGIKICRQAQAKWVEKFDKRLDPHGKPYFWLTGEFVEKDGGTDTDEWALKNNFASVVPVTFDLTHYGWKEAIKNWNL
jgi:5'-nucleotidase